MGRAGETEEMSWFEEVVEGVGGVVDVLRAPVLRCSCSGLALKSPRMLKVSF